MRKPKLSIRSKSHQRGGVRLLEEVSAIPARIGHRILKPMQTHTGRGIAAVRRTQVPTVGSIASFVAVVLDLDGASENPAT